MRFKLPFNDRITVRAFERVETVDDQYDIVDVGLEYASGRIDSIAIGGSFHTLKSWTSADDKKAARKARRKARRSDASKDSKGDTPTDND